MMNLANFSEIDYLKSEPDSGSSGGSFSLPTTATTTIINGDAMARAFFAEQPNDASTATTVDRFDSPNTSSSDHLSSGASIGHPLPAPAVGAEVLQTSERMPDADSLKMFIGQIPKDWTEVECRQLLEPYGPIYALNILKDKDSKKSKGCCFVTYYTRKAALDAQNDLHNLKKLPTCRNPIQMKPADNENKNDRKLFIGKLPKFMNESDVSSVFANYGIVEECIVLRDSNNQSKGCAFVTFSSRSSATSAIRALHQTKTLEGCTTPIVVKFAEAGSKGGGGGGEQGKRSGLKNGSLSGSISSSAAATAAAAAAAAAAAFSPLSSLQAAGSPLLDSSYFNLIKAHQMQQQQVQQVQQQQQHQQQLLAALQSSQSPYGSLASAEAAMAAVYGGGLLPSLGGGAGGAKALLSAGAAAAAHQQLFGSAAGGSPKLLGEAATGLPLSQFASLAGPHHHALSHSAYSALTAPALAKLAASAAAVSSQQTSTPSRQMEGPEGANLFIYHLPAEYTDVDLVSLFAPYGNVISAKVFIDKNSNLSKCFGFVSYDNSDSAQAAIRAMNGFQVLNKRLKVQLKKVRDRPY